MHSLNLDVTMRVEKKALLDAIKKQREEHAKSYKAALAGWRQSMIMIAQQIIEKGPRLKKFPLAVRKLNSPPDCHLQDFDDAISMISMSTGTGFDLSSDDYEQLVLGRWEWRREWTASNTRYMTGSTGSAGPTGEGGITDDELE